MGSPVSGSRQAPHSGSILPYAAILLAQISLTCEPRKCLRNLTESVLVGVELVHPVPNQLFATDHDVGFLRVTPRLGVLVRIAEDRNLIVNLHKLAVEGEQRG